MQSMGIDDDLHKKRFKEEFWEVDVREKYSYFLDLYAKGIKYQHNQNNLLIVELLGIAPGFDISRPPECTIGDFPDIDIDYLGPIRDYLKNEWAPKFFGRENVSNIGSYNTFGMKSALIDMAKVHGLERNEILKLTKDIKSKDEDGKPITWETALQMSKSLRLYCENNPEVATAARKLMDRNRSRGKHAGGLIIANAPLDELVPLVVDTHGQITSAWTEGLHSQDLSPVGLVKFDLLVITNNEQVAKISKLIKERHGIESICALPGKSDWTDIKYLNDPEALKLANSGKMKGIFQFDSPGIRSLVIKGGVKRFDDLVAYTSLFRPGPLDNFLHDVYCDRSSGKERYEIHPLLEPILKSTYGVLCIHEDTLISKVDGTEIPISQIKKGDKVQSVNLDSLEIESDICDGCAPTRKCDGLKITLENGFSVTVTPDHNLLTAEGMKEAQRLTLDLVASKSKTGVIYFKIKSIEKVENQQFYGMSVRKNHNLLGNGIVIKNCYQEQIMQVANVVGKIPMRDCYALIKAISKKDITVFGKYKEMFIENGQRVLGWSKDAMTNYWDQIESFAGYAFNKSHAIAYTYLSSRLLYLKAHYPLEFFAGLLGCETNADKIHEYKNDAFQFEITTLPVDINKSKEVAGICDEKIYIGVSNIKGIGVESAKKIASLRPYTSYFDFLDRYGTDSNANKPFIAMRVFKDDEPLILYKYYEYFKTQVKSREARNNRNKKRKEQLRDSYDNACEANNEKLMIEFSNKLDKCIKDFENKIAKDEPITLEYYKEHILPTDDTYVEDELLKQFADLDVALNDNYGFQWVSPVTKSPDFMGEQSFDDLRVNGSGPVEMYIKDFVKKKSQKGTTYYQVKGLDMNEEERWINIWQNDYEVWKDEIVAGNILRMRVKLPTGDFTTYSMESFPRNYKKITKEDDYRIKVMKNVKVEEVKILTDEEILESVAKEDFGMEV